MLFQWMRKHLFCAVGFAGAGLMMNDQFSWTGMNSNRMNINYYNVGDSAQKKQFFRLNSMHCRRVARMACLAMDFRRHFNFSKVFVCWARGESVYAVAVYCSFVVCTHRHWHMQTAPATNRTRHSHSTGNWRRTHTHIQAHSHSDVRELRTAAKKRCGNVNGVRSIVHFVIVRNRFLYTLIAMLCDRCY